MCAKPPKPKKVEEKPVQYLNNPFLDGLAIGQQPGRSSLRIDLGSQPAAPAAPAQRSQGSTQVPAGLLIPNRPRSAYAIQ